MHFCIKFIALFKLIPEAANYHSLQGKPSPDLPPPLVSICNFCFPFDLFLFCSFVCLFLLLVVGSFVGGGCIEVYLSASWARCLFFVIFLASLSQHYGCSGSKFKSEFCLLCHES